MIRYRLHFGRWTFNVTVRDEDHARKEGADLLKLHHPSDFDRLGGKVESVAASAIAQRVV